MNRLRLRLALAGCTTRLTARCDLAQQRRDPFPGLEVGVPAVVMWDPDLRALRVLCPRSPDSVWECGGVRIKRGWG